MMTAKKTHPMDVNTNTRLRWDVIKDIPQLNDLKGKNILDLGSGLGFFSACLQEKGATVLAVDIDIEALNFIQRTLGIKTRVLNVEREDLPDEQFDHIFIGELLEHVEAPNKLIQKCSHALKPGGGLIISTPALEGLWTNSWGKRLCHTDGSEKHERDGFTRNDLEGLVRDNGLNTTNHYYCIYYLSELFMQLTKLIYSIKKKNYHGQSDIISTMNSIHYRVLKCIFPFLHLVFKIEHCVMNYFQLTGHCHIIHAVKR